MIIKAFISFIVTLIFLCISNESICQTISNVNSKQSGNTIEITYTLSTTTPCEIALYVSLDGGKTWKGPLAKVQGDVGKNISAGEHTITWQVLEEFEELSSDNIKFKVESVGKKPFEPEMVFVEGGSFFIGNSSSSPKKLRPEEYPEHLAYVSSFLISKSEVTQAQWRLVMGSNPSIFKGCDQCPVENVSFNDVENFITKINSLTGKKYRLPTEAEWELAARGGLENTTGSYFSDTNELSFITEGEDEYGIPIRLFVPHLSQGWFINNSESKTHKSGLKAANPIGLYDMGGNVAEWCSDWYSSYEHGISVNPIGPENGDKRVVRGGSFADKQIACRFASRKGYSPSTKTNKVGFRLALSAEQETDPSSTSNLQNPEFVINPIWSYLKVHNLTKKGEREFLKVYTNPDSCKIIWNFAVANELTDLNENEFCEWLLPEDGSISKEPRALARSYFFDGMTRLALGDIFNRKNCDADLSFDKGIKYDESCAQLFYGRGYCALWFGGQSDLIEDFEKAYSLDNSYTKPLMELAYYYNGHSHTPNREKAFNLYTKVISIDPQNVHAYEQRAMISGFYGSDYSNAIKDITKCIDFTDNKNYYFEKRAEYKAKAKDYRGAIEDLSSAIEIGPVFCIYFLNRARYKDAIEDYAGAISDYTESIECYNESLQTDAFMGRGDAKYNIGDYTGAVMDYTKAIELEGDGYRKSMLHLWRAHSYLQSEKYSMAISDYSKVIQLNPEHNPEWVLDAYYSRGLARVYSGAKESGCQDLRKAADLGNEDAIDAVRENCQ